MRMLRKLAARFAGLFRRERRDSELAAEMDAHLQMHIEENVRRGMSPGEARRQALIKLGGMEQTKESYREQRGVPFTDALVQDVRYGLRMLRKSPAFTIVAVLTLALGIGANTAIFSVVDGVVLRPLPYPDSNRIVYLGWQDKQNFIPDLNVPELAFIRDHATSFTSVAGFQGVSDKQLTEGTSKRWVAAGIVSDGFFETLGVNPQTGRAFGREFTQPGGADGAVLSDALWRTAFASDPNIVGRQIILDGRPYTVTGVLPPGFKYVQPADLFIPLHFGGNFGDIGLTVGNSHETFAIAGTLTIPVFQGGKVHGDLVQANAQLKQKKDQLENLKAQIGYDVRTALMNLKTAADQVNVAQSNVSLADQTLAQAKDRFAAGVTDNIEVVQAQEAVANADQTYISSLYQHNLAKVALARAAGIAEQAVLQYLGGK